MDYFLKASAITAIFYVCYMLFLQRETFFASNRWFLILGLVTSVLSPFMVIPIYVELAAPIYSDGFTIIATTTKDTAAFDVSTGLIWVYRIGASFFIGKIIIQLISLVALIKPKGKKKIGDFTFVETAQNIAPFSFFRWIVYNPQQFKARELQLILKHEKVHASQLHSIDVLFMDLATALFWFNPMIWLYRKALKQNLEFIADYHTQKQSGCHILYQKLLLKTCLPQQDLMLINTFYNSTIKNRIVMLHKSKSNLANSWKYTIIVPLLVIFAMTFNTEIIAKTADQLSETLVTSQQNILKFIVTKDSKDNELELIKDKLAERGATIVFKNLKRNSKNEITTIKIKHELQGQKDVHYSKLSEPISPIIISFNPSTKAISIGQQTSTSTETSDTEFVVDGFKATSTRIISGKTKLNSNGMTKALILVDGKEITKDEMDAIDPNNIQSISILKDENALKIYGKKGKDGVILLTLKKENTSIQDDGQEIINSHNKDIKFRTDKIHSTNPEGKDKGLLFIKKDTPKTTIYKDEKKPLIIVDGKEINKTEMESLNPETIKSMEVLKDEFATKKYGEKGEHGVIIITLKKE